MDNSKRQYCSGKILLSQTQDGTFAEEYFIKSVIGEGGSAICYEATRKRKDGRVETGKLKEFYPLETPYNYYSFERLSNGQLVPKAGTIREFYNMCDDYLDAYTLLNKIIEDNPENEILKGYIQYGEVLYGCVDPKVDPERRKPTVYIWSPGVPGTGFDKYIADIKRKPAKDAEEKLLNILSVMESLTDCVKALHTAGLLHLDINPSNFLVQYDSDYVIKTEKISLFDINTLTSVDSKYFTACGTDGFCAPEIVKRKADNRTDIYSLGAMLFNAIVVEKGVENSLYRDYFYPSINQMVKHSSLFAASETNSDVALMSRICKILNKCLAVNPKQRYSRCAELKEDLLKAKERLERLLKAPIDKNIIGVADSTIVVQKLLYAHPIYESANKEAKNINVLVLGLDNYGQKFIDICLQTGQMQDVNLNIVAISENIVEDKNSYMGFRPALGEFVNVDGSLNGREKDAYATLEFKGLQDVCSDVINPRFTKRNSQKTKDTIENIILDSIVNEKEYDYVFISLENDELNKYLARRFSDELKHKCPVCYVSLKVAKEYKPDTKNKIYPVCVSEPLNVSAIEQGFGEMAFNTHLSWKDSFNIDIANERKKFFEGESEEDKYNRISSLAFALSVKYKLHSVEIECDDLLQAAKEFSQKILETRESDDESMAKYNRLVDLEHRRWVIERAIDGWKAPRDQNGALLLEECFSRGSVKDFKKRTHPCMVRGSEASPLKSYTKTDWDDMSKKLDGLDELDRMSVELHRCFKKHADELINGNLLQQSDVLFIQNLIPADKGAVVRAFKEYQFALKNIINGVEKYSKEYDYYENSLKSELKILPDEERVKIEKRLEVIRHAFFPVIESNLYRNYKSYDEVLVQKIPFILSYRHTRSMAMAFEAGEKQNGRNDAVFSNVASASILSPDNIRFLYFLHPGRDTKLFLSKLDAVLNYLCKRKVYTCVDLAVACPNATGDPKINELQDGLKKIGKKYEKDKNSAWYNNNADFYYEVDSSGAIIKFGEYLKNNPVDLFDGSNSLFDSAFDDGVFLGKLFDLKVPYFEFEPQTKSFTKHINCDHLVFVKDSSFLRIRDMFALMNAKDVKFTFPEFADDYESLWTIYTGTYVKTPNKFENGVKNWNKLCEALQKYDEVHNKLAEFRISKNSNVEVKKLTLFLPEYVYSTVNDIIEKLSQFGVLETETVETGKSKEKIIVNKSQLKAHTGDTCKVELVFKKCYESELKKIFNKPNILMPYYGIDISTYKDKNDICVKVAYENLLVENGDLDPDYKFRDSVQYSYVVLEQLQDANFIRGLRKEGTGYKSVSFEYSSPRIRKLLTSAGEILEIYAYYESLKTGYFDDVASGYEFNWEYDGVKNELDLVLTKGFKSIIVECKAVQKLTLDYFHKLHSIADQFGIGTTKILLGNTYTNSEVDNEINKMQRSRGQQLRIKTIYGENKIRNIGESLKDLMEKN